LRAQLALGDADAVFYAAGNPEKFYKFAARRAARSARNSSW
jgi:hypothetical protein